MNMIRNIKLGLIASVMLLFVSCNSWLEVDPDDRIMDNSLFKDREGFLAGFEWRVFGNEYPEFVRGQFVNGND